MATNTYVALDTQTISSPVTTLTFSPIPSGYTDLVIVANTIVASGTGYELGLQFNGDTGSNYSNTYLLGSGSSAISGRATNLNYADCGFLNANSGRPNTRVINIMNYANTNTNKTVISRGAGLNGGQSIAYANLWRNNSAITSITIVSASGLSYAIGSTFSIYGITAEAVTPAPKATGGSIYSDSTYYYHVFGSTGVFTPSTSLTCDYVVVAGGGGGGGQQGGGGGAGGLRAFASASLSATNYPVTVGGGGNGGFGNASRGVNGSNSSFNSNSVTGGGGGATNGIAAGSGGSGGGGGINSSANGSGNAGSYSPVEGFAGGATSSGDGGAGGGGAAAAGTAKNGSGNGQNGGIGASVYNSIDFTNWLTATGLGTSGKLAGGGGGGTSSSFSVGVGGAGGGGTGGNVEQGAALPYQHGVFASGGGGGGGSQFNANANGGNGGSGVVVIRYLKA